MMESIIVVYIIIASVISPIAVLEFYQRHFKECPYTYLELTFYEYVALIIIGAIFGGFIFPFIIIRGFIEIINGIKEDN